MIQPILFVDEKKIEGTNQYRYASLKELIYQFDCENTIEFLSDIGIKDFKNKEDISVITSPIFDQRNLIIIHASKNDEDNKFSSDIVKVFRSTYPKIIFAEFSGRAKINLNENDLRFRRQENIYEEGGVRLLLFTLYYKKYNEFEFEILIKGNELFEKAKRNSDILFNSIKNSINSTNDLENNRDDKNVEDLLGLLGLNFSEIEVQKEILNNIFSIEEYLHFLIEYQNKIEEKYSIIQHKLNSISNEYLYN